MTQTATQMNEMEQKYYEVMELYSLADELVLSTESNLVANPDAQLDLVEPLADAMGSSADILTEEFIALVDGKANRKTIAKKKIEDALRQIYTAISDYSEKSAQMMHGVSNVADPIVKRIKRQLEAVIAVFVDFVTLSLDRIMQKNDVEELKQRQEKIALMLHSMGQQAT
ncbi:MAG: hypothetical protein J0M34_04145 [Alphaproteobacteria bacterium]|nr:hypothetical protein [Alphaproteobacteria bacterium]